MYPYSGSGQSNIYILILIVLVLALRLVRSRGARPVNPIMPVITTLLVLYGTYELIALGSATGAAASGASAPTFRVSIDPSAMPFYVLGAVLGVAIGLFRGSTITIYRDAATGQIMQKSAALALLIWVGLFALRFGIRYLAGAGLIGSWATPVSDVLLLLGTGSILGRNAYVLWRYFQLSGSATTVKSS